MTTRRKEPPRRARSESSIPPRRISQTTIIMPDEEATSSRTPALSDVPAVWLDRLLVELGAAPVARGEEAVAQSLVDALGALLPSYAIGVCYVAAPGMDQRVLSCVPVVERSRGGGADPTRLFPGFSHERVFEVAGVAQGSTLHVAGDDPTLDDDRAPAVHLACRAAEGLGRALDHARALTAAGEAKRELRDLADGIVQTEKLASFGELAAGLVHELNNPLTSIVAYSDLLLKSALARGDSFDDVERIRRVGESAQRILRFTRDVVAYVRPADGAAAAVPIHRVIDQALAFCDHVIAEAGATVERHFDPAVSTIPGVAERLTQVFVNVVTNACHALPPEGGRIAIETAAVTDGRRVRIVVADTGVGIDPDNVPRIFAPFFTTKKSGRGTGLGLAIVRGIVEGHGGTIAAHSAPGCGTRFIIDLPANS